MPKPILAYWNIRGLSEPILYLLHYKNVDFENKTYVHGTDNWRKDKFNLGLDFPNLPYYLEDDIKISQSTAILRYLARKYDLDGKDDRQKVLASMVEQQLVDLRFNLFLLMQNGEIESEKAEFVKNLPNHMKLWEKFLGNKKFLLGDNITYVDFIAYETFDVYEKYHASVLENFPRLQNFQKRFESLPELQEYLNSPIHKRPVAGIELKFG
ncbi:Glutathione S-transferase Mu 1 [Araneus ventricosus]|uniref:glutathione transferase n=1 Tax=Araneus ventricosus TaxID=182803 RepID=A0A4Y2UDP9_ARAVE|nr:Glutathione S-transferase Mu 1 [Araneus ventricosus]